MSSKQLDSILKNIPSATVTPTQREEKNIYYAEQKQKEEMERIVASVPKSVKDEIREFLSKNKKETEKTVILRGLKAIGFNIKTEWLVDKRSLR